MIEEPKNYMYVEGKRIQLYPRPPHATVSIITHKDDFESMDEYLESCYNDYTVSFLKSKTLPFEESWQQVFEAMNLQFNRTKRSIYYECIEFGGNSEFWEDMSDEDRLQYFKWCYDFAVRYIGFNCTDDNIMFAYILDRENRHVLEVYYLPVTNRLQRKVYSHKRSPSGGYLQAKDFNGDFIYEDDYSSQFYLSHHQFWKDRGGETAYSSLQEDFYQQVSESYYVKRGESLSPTKYTCNAQKRRYNRYEGDEYDQLYLPYYPDEED